MEDIGFGDVTTESIVGEDKIFNAKLVSRCDGVICGLEVFKTVFKVLSDKVKVELLFKDGDKIKKGDWIESETAPEEIVPQPIWLYHDHIKVYIPQEDCWKTVKNLDVKDLDLQKLRITQNETLRI